MTREEEINVVMRRAITTNLANAQISRKNPPLRWVVITCTGFSRLPKPGGRAGEGRRWGGRGLGGGGQRGWESHWCVQRACILLSSAEPVSEDVKDVCILFCSSLFIICRGTYTMHRRHMYIQVYTYMHVCTHTCTHTHTHIHVYTCTHIQHVHVHAHTHMHTHTHTCIYMYTHTCTCAHTHAYTHTHTHLDLLQGSLVYPPDLRVHGIPPTLKPPHYVPRVTLHHRLQRQREGAVTSIFYLLYTTHCKYMYEHVHCTCTYNCNRG